LLTRCIQFGYDQGVFGGVIVTDDFLDTLGIRNDVNMKSTVTVRDPKMQRQNNARDTELT
jgi:hypothetical protein